MSESSFNVEQIRDFLDLARRSAELDKRRTKLADHAARLQAEIVEIDRETSEIHEKLENDFAELNEAGLSFGRPAEPTDSELIIENTEYVKQDTKEKLLRKILDDYAFVNPEAKSMSYSEVKKTLASEYKIECKSIANFFVGVLSEYETTGGNRNKAIVLPVE